MLELDHIRKLRHDPIVNELVDIMHGVGVVASSEVTRLFRNVLSETQWAEYLRLHPNASARRGKVPDIVATTPSGPVSTSPAASARLFEVKTISMCKTRYRPSFNRRRQAVQARAQSIHAEYVSACRANDRTVCGTPAGTPGPFENKLNTFPPVIGLVVGGLGEFNDTFDLLISILAEIGAKANQRRMLAPSWQAAKSALVWQINQRLGFCALRGIARLKLTRALYVGPDGARSASAEAQGYRHFDHNRHCYTDIHQTARCASYGTRPKGTWGG